MSGHRQAAVALHGLAEEDRTLILAELPPADQATLQDYLNSQPHTHDHSHGHSH